ncbi:MAG TPA: S41 family peptidase [Candidatus Limnocylindria bacterium]|nr:S41 family peptidase [Candidatus Limnocylindria bacterium]
MPLRRLGLSLTLAVVAVGCSILPPELQRELLPTQTQYNTAQAAFQIIIDKHVDKPTSKQLVPGALDGVVAYLKRENITQTPVVDRPDLTGAEWSDFAKLTAALDAVIARYPTVKKDLLERAAVDGMARSMNECHTYYLDPDRAKTFNRPPAPVSGIGVTINQPDQQSPIEVIDVIPNTPAEKAGVKKGDKIVKVNGEDVTKLTTSEVADRVRGPEGTQVTIVFDRQGAPLELTITRARFTTPLTDSRLEGGDIAYVRIKQLISTVANDAANAVRQMQTARGVILDLRDDPGGELSVAVDVGSLFVKTGPLVYQTGRDGQRNPIEVNPRRYMGLTVPLVVLVNKNSASGSEIIAAGVRSSGAGTVMGTRTAGCVGSGQPRDLPDGGLLLVTLTKMQDAKTGEDLNGPGKGVVPDQTVEDDAKTPNVDEALQAAVAFLHSHS